MFRHLFTEKRTLFLFPSTPNVVQKHYEEDREERLNFVKWYLQGVYDELELRILLCITFHVTTRIVMARC
jgi:hypothetical protein